IGPATTGPSSSGSRCGNSNATALTEQPRASESDAADVASAAVEIDTLVAAVEAVVGEPAAAVVVAAVVAAETVAVVVAWVVVVATVAVVVAAVVVVAVVAAAAVVDSDVVAALVSGGDVTIVDLSAATAGVTKSSTAARLPITDAAAMSQHYGLTGAVERLRCRRLTRAG